MVDILVYGTNKIEHDSSVHKVLERLQLKGVTLNKEKCCFSVERISFLGIVFDASGARRDPEKVRAIKGLPRSQNFAEVWSFLGMVNHLARFLPDAASMSAPLRSLLCIDNDWLWGPQQERAFAKNQEHFKLGNVPCTLQAKISDDRLCGRFIVRPWHLIAPRPAAPCAVRLQVTNEHGRVVLPDRERGPCADMGGRTFRRAPERSHFLVRNRS